MPPGRWWQDRNFFKLKRSVQGSPGTYFSTSPVRMPGVSSLPRPLLRTWGWEGEREAPATAWEEREARPQPAGPYLGSTACPRRARGPEAPAGAARPRPARGRPRRRLPSRTGSAAPRPAGLPPSAAPVGSALYPRKRPRGWDLGQAWGWGMRGLPGLLGLSRLGLPQSRHGRKSCWAGRYF